MKAQARSPIFYGWVIVAAGFVVLSVSYLVRYTFSVFFVAILEDFGWSRALTAGVFSVAGVVYGVASPFFGALSDRWGSRRVVGVGAVILALGMAGSSLISAPWHYYLSFGIVAALGTSATGYVLQVALLSNWFQRRLGLVLGIVSAGIGFGILLGVPLAQYLITLFGWRPTYLILAVAVLVIMLPLTGLMTRRPQDRGLLPDGATQAPRQPSLPEPDNLAVDHAWAGREWTVRSAAATRRFWLVLAGGWLINFGSQMAIMHQVALMVDAGYDKMLAATAVGMLGIASMVGKMTTGMASDRWGRERVFSAGMTCGIVGFGLLALARTVVLPWLPYACGLWIGLGYSVSATMMPTVSSDLFRGRNFGSVFGCVNMSSNIGAAVGAWLAGYIYDLSGDYLLALVLGAGGFAAAIVSLLLVAPRRVRLAPGQARRSARPARQYS